MGQSPVRRLGEWLAALLLLTGCVVSSEEYKSMVSYDPVRAEGRIDAAVRVEAAYTISPEGIEAWKNWGNPEENIDNYRSAVAEMLVEDMARSGIFTSVNAPGRADYDAVIRIEAADSKRGEEYWLAVTVSILDPATQAAGAQYKREMSLGDSVFGYNDAMKQALASALASIRSEVLAASKGQGLHAILASVRAAQAAKAAQASIEAVQASQAKGDLVGAMAATRKALMADPSGVGPVISAVALLQTLCDPDGARRLGEEGLKAHPNDPGLQAALARTDIATHPPACEAQARNREAIALARAGQRPEALQKLAQARTLAPGLIPKASFNAAVLLEQDNKAPEAVAAYLEAYKTFLTPAERSDALTRLVALVQRAGIATPDPVDRRYRLGIVRAQQKRYPEAITEFEAALAEAPWLVDAYYNLGLVYDLTGNYPDALQAFRNYVALAPSAPNVGTVKTKIVELEDRLTSGPPPPAVAPAPVAAPAAEPEPTTRWGAKKR